MRISQMIERLLEIQQTYGDLEVHGRTDDSDFEPVGQLEVERELGYDTQPDEDDLSFEEIEQIEQRELAARGDGHWTVFIW